MTGRTIAEKIIGRSAGYPEAREGQILEASPDLVMSHENTFLVNKSFSELGKERPWDPEKIVIVLDHRTPANTTQTATVHSKIREIVKGFGISKFFDAGEGICHQLLVEKRLARPGQLILGTDSHTTTAGAIGAFATGIGATEMAGVWATGRIWLKVPRSIMINMFGTMPKGVFAKDISLYLAGIMGPSGAEYKCMEFSGELIPSMSISSRMVLCNMSMEMGAKGAVMPCDEVTRSWYRGHSDSELIPISSDENARYDNWIDIEVDGLTPMVSGPHKVEAVKSVEKMKGIVIDQAFIGTCTNGRLEDLEAAAMILKGQKVSPNCRLIVAPASRDILTEAADRGYMQIILKAGGTILPPGCGPCLGSHGGVLGPKEVCISSSNRNFPGRMGSDIAEIYLASPATVAASAIVGRITDPRSVMQ